MWKELPFQLGKKSERAERLADLLVEGVVKEDISVLFTNSKAVRQC